MKRIAIILLVITIIIVGVSFILKTCDQGSGQPGSNAARYQINADSRTYYTNSYTQGTDRYGKYITLFGYWSFDGKYWIHNSTDLYLSFRGYKSVVVVDRTAKP
jgi:hypothetical protein